MDLMKLKAILTLDSGPYERGVSQAIHNGEKVGGGIASGMKIAGAAFAAAGAATTAFAIQSVRTGAKFDSAMSQVAATMGTTVDQIQDLRDFAMEMGSKTAFSATQSAEALNYMALAGYDAETSMSMLPNVLNLAAAGGMELATASDMITDTQSALGLSIEETSELVDKMAKASSKSNTSVEQLGSAMLTVGGTAKMMKGGTTELSTALGILADNGTKGAEGGTALRNILTSIAGKKFGDTFGEMGVSAYDAEGKMRSLKDILGDMNDAMEGMTDEEKTKMINATFNARDLKNVNALLATSTDRWDELSSAIDDSAGAAQDMADTQLDNLEGDITLFKSALEGVQIALSDKLTPAIRGFVQIGTDGLTLLNDLLNNGFSSESVSSAFESMPEQISNALDTGFNTAKEAVSNGLKTLMRIPWEHLFSEAMSGLGETFSSALDLALQFDALKTDMMQKMMTVAKDMIIGFIEAVVEQGPNLLTQGIEAVANFVAGIYENATAVVNGAVNLVNKLVDYISNNSDKIAVSAVKMVVALGKGIVNNAPKILSGVGKLVSAIIKGVIKIVPKLPPLAIKIVASLAGALGKGAGKLLDAAGDLARKAVDKLKDGFNKVKDIGTNIVHGIGEGITNGKKWIKDKIRSFVGNVKSFLKNLFGIKSPSKWARDNIGKMIDAGLALGITSNADMVDDAMEDLIPDIDSRDFSLTRQTPPIAGNKVVQPTFNLYNTIDGAEDPETWADRFSTELQMRARMA